MKNQTNQLIRNAGAKVSAALAAVSMLAMPAMVMAQDVTGATTRVNSFFNNIASIAIVTIAVIFAGYQIAFNHKRIGDVAPVLIGGFLIGAAAQIAKMLLPADVTKTTMVISELLHYA
ncbi:MAG: TrbC/VirB2 family protein [Stenotrophomonas sp.]